MRRSQCLNCGARRPDQTFSSPDIYQGYTCSEECDREQVENIARGDSKNPRPVDSRFGDYAPCRECQKRIEVGADRYMFKHWDHHVFCSMECMRLIDQKRTQVLIDGYRDLVARGDEEALEDLAWNEMRLAKSTKEFKDYADALAATN